MKQQNSTIRFSDRVSDYIKYRPHYPEEVVPYLEGEWHISPGSHVADVGSGTGISGKLFLEKGYTVTGIEPNEAMREASVTYLQGYYRFHTVSASAEATTLPDNSIDVIMAAQAFHWFDTGAVKREFKRILKPGGLIVLMWNERLTASDFERKYDDLITRHAIDYVQIDHRNMDREHIERFFAPNQCRLKTFPNFQDFDFEGLKGRLMSSSYIPKEGAPGYEAMIHELRTLFDRYQSRGMIRITYDTKVYAARAGEWNESGRHG